MSDLFDDTKRAAQSFFRGLFRYLLGKRKEGKLHGWRLLYRLRTEMVLSTSQAITGVTHRVRARLWVDEEAFPRIRRLLRRAKHTVIIRMFIWKDDELGKRMAATLLDAADRGVSVDIVKEPVGEVFELHRNFLGTKDSWHPLWQKFWNHPRIHVSVGTEHDHAKVYAIDGRILLLTGMNIANEYHERLHDYLVELRGHAFVREYLTDGEMKSPQRDIRLVLNREHQRNIRPALMSLLQDAKSSIVLEQSYVSDPQVLEELIRKSKNGISVTLIIPESVDLHGNANKAFASRLLREGDKEFVKIFIYPGMFHGKAVLVDRSIAFIGSANLMKSSIDDMGEANVLVRGRHQPVVRKLRETLRNDLVHSRLVDRENFPPFRRLLAWLKL